MNYPTPPAFSLTSSLKKSISEMPLREHPGPGPIYDLDSAERTFMKRSYSIGKAQRLAINHGIQRTPSPNHYSPKKKHKQLQITIPKSTASNPENDLPPPNAHYPVETLIKSRLLTYTMGEKYPSIMDSANSNPGPGQYETSGSLPILTKSKNISEKKFGTAQRFRAEDNRIPGVGQYSAESVSQIIQKKITIPKDERLKGPSQILPGPSDYPIKSIFTVNRQNPQGKSLAGRYKDPLQVKDPTSEAFIKYFNTTEKSLVAHTSIPKYSIGKQKRDSFKDGKTPGPTEYMVETFLSKNSYRFIMPQSQRAQYNDTVNNPGPGSYSISSPTGKMPVIGRSKSMAVIAQTPGPGRYQPKLLQKQGRVVFPRDRREKLRVGNETGVGDYNINESKSSVKGGFGKAQRFAEAELSQPGPGDYQIHTLIGYGNRKKKSMVAHS